MLSLVHETVTNIVAIRRISPRPQQAQDAIKEFVFSFKKQTGMLWLSFSVCFSALSGLSFLPPWSFPFEQGFLWSARTSLLFADGRRLLFYIFPCLLRSWPQGTGCGISAIRLGWGAEGSEGPAGPGADGFSQSHGTLLCLSCEVPEELIVGEMRDACVSERAWGWIRELTFSHQLKPGSRFFFLNLQKQSDC